MTKGERLAIFRARLNAAPPSATFDEANALISRLLTEVEDAHSGLPNNLGTGMNDGRMYPVLPDNVHTVNGRPKVKRLRSKAHETFIGENGSIEIRLVGRTDAIVDKAGADELKVSAL